MGERGRGGGGCPGKYVGRMLLRNVQPKLEMPVECVGGKNTRAHIGIHLFQAWTSTRAFIQTSV